MEVDRYLLPQPLLVVLPCLRHIALLVLVLVLVLLVLVLVLKLLVVECGGLLF